MVQIFFDRIRYRIRLEGFKSVRIRVRIFNIRYHIRIRILKSHIYDVDIQSYPIRHGWHYPYSNPNPDRNMKTNVISMISVRIRSVFIPSCSWPRIAPCGQSWQAAVVFLLIRGWAILRCDVHVHLMRIDLFQDLYRCSGGKITLMKYGHNMPIFINGEDTQDLSYNIGWLHLSESKSIGFLYKNI